jgi:hypothetical protein
MKVYHAAPPRQAASLPLIRQHWHGEPRSGHHCGKKKAIVALEHRVLVIIYHVLRTKKTYADLGPDYFDQRDLMRVERHHIQRLEQLGYSVTLTPKEAA